MDDKDYEFQERSAIMYYDAGIDFFEAEKRAKLEIAARNIVDQLRMKKPIRLSP